jgi:hypothetical protein
MNRSIQLMIVATLLIAFCPTTAYSAVSVGLLANLARTVAIPAGTPLTFQVTVGDFDAQAAISENAARRAETEMLDEDLRDGRITREQYQMRIQRLDTIAYATTTLGSPAAPWYSRIVWQVTAEEGSPVSGWERHLMRMPPVDSVVVLDASRIAIAAFGIDPETTQGITPGTYRIRLALLPTALSPAASDTIWSEPVSIQILPPRTQAGSFDERLRLADYFRRRGRDGDALALAQSLLGERPEDLNALEIKGDALAGLGRIDESLATFNQAIVAFETQRGPLSEPPMYLIRRIDELLAQLPEQRIER